MSSSLALSETDILAEVVNSDQVAFDPDMARAILRLKFSESHTERMRELADKHNRGVLSEDERETMENFRRVGNLLAVWQAKARLSLKRAEPSE